MGRPKKILTAEEIAEREKKKAEKNAEKEKLEERRERELALFVGGGSFRQIAEQISKSTGEKISKSTVEKDINLLLDREINFDERFMKRMRAVNIRRLNNLLIANTVGANNGDLKKGEFCRKVIGDLSDLSGANMPVKVESSGTVDNVQYTLAEWKAEQQRRREQAANTKQMFADEK